MSFRAKEVAIYLAKHHYLFAECLFTSPKQRQLKVQMMLIIVWNGANYNAKHH
jgi:hypothetical protein